VTRGAMKVVAHAVIGRHCVSGCWPCSQDAKACETLLLAPAMRLPTELDAKLTNDNVIHKTTQERSTLKLLAAMMNSGIVIEPARIFGWLF
jgi:hypothetical protein